MDNNVSAEHKTGLAEELSGLIDRLDAAERFAAELDKSGKGHGHESSRTRHIAVRLISAAACLAAIVGTGIARHLHGPGHGICRG